MRRPFYIAMGLSLAIHVALLILIEWLISDRVEPSLKSTVLTVSVRHLSVEVADAAEQQSAYSTIINEAGSHTKTRKSDKISDRQAKIADRIETFPALKKNPNRLNRVGVAPGSSKRDNIGLGHADAGMPTVPAEEKTEVAESDALRTAAQRKQVVTASESLTAQPALTHAPLSPRQEKMLKRKLKDWTENLYRMPDAAASVTWRYGGQEYLAKFTQLPAESDMGIPRATVEIITEENGKRFSMEMRMTRLAFSNYAQFVNRWDPNVQIHDDELTGRFHSNSKINLAYSRKIKPQFHGKVTTTARSINVSERRGFVKRDQIFLGGLQTGVRAIRLPKRFKPFIGEENIADEQVRLFDEDMRITFYADGSYGWQAVRSTSPQGTAAISGDTSYLIAAKTVKLHVKGTVNGKVLVYSPERIVIEDDLVYAQDPHKITDADDYLGLVSDKYVDIAPPEITGPGDLVIHAAIYAKRRMAVKNYRRRENALLFIYGSLTAGSLSATEPRYRTRIQFDQRLEKQRPPGFPVTNRYVVESRDAAWKVEPVEILH